jgi:DNA invertase Pin-like site-specific DNA recombinase
MAESSQRPRRTALYLRASTAKKTAGGEDYAQRPEIQEERLRRLCEQRGWQVIGVYSDRASGRRDQRPGLDQLMAEARRGAFDVVAVTSFDRFARSVRHLVLALDEFRELGIDFVSLREAVDTSTPLGKATFTIIAAMAELESALIAERTRAGLEFARRHGTRSGRPIGRQPRLFDRIKALELRAQGYSYREIARLLKIPLGTLHGALRRFRSQNHAQQEPVNVLENCDRLSGGAGV